MSRDQQAPERQMPRRAFLARARSRSVRSRWRRLRPLRAHSAGTATAKGELNLVGLDHVGITVPDIDQAIEWFEDMLGARRTAHVRSVRRPDGHVHAGPARRRPARRDRPDHDAADRAQREHRALPVRRRPTSGTTCPKNSDLVGTPHRVLRHGHRRGRRVHGLEGRRRSSRAVPAHRRAGCGADDQLLPHAVRHVHRVHQLPERDGLPGARRQAALVAEARTGSTRR